MFIIQQKGKTLHDIAEDLKLSKTTVQLNLKWYHLCRDFPKFLNTGMSYTVGSKDADSLRSAIGDATDDEKIWWGGKVEPAKVERKVTPAKVTPAKVEPAKVEPVKVTPVKVAQKVVPAKVAVPVNQTRVLRKHMVLEKLWHQESGFVFHSAQNRIVVGKCIDDKLYPLTEDDKTECRKWGFQFDTIPPDPVPIDDPLQLQMAAMSVDNKPTPMTMTDKPTYVCDKCQKPYIYKGSYNKHINTCGTEDYDEANDFDCDEGDNDLK